MTLQSQIVQKKNLVFSPISCSFSILTRRAQSWQRSSTVGYSRLPTLPAFLIGPHRHKEKSHLHSVR